MRVKSIAVLAFFSWGLAASAEVTSMPVTPVTDQGLTLQCWAVTSTARMDVDASRNAGHLLKLSARYLVYTKTRAEVVRLILSGKFEEYDGAICEGCARQKIYYEQGGVYADAVEAAKVYGVMPESAYPGFPEKDTGLFRDLNVLIRKYAKVANRTNFTNFNDAEVQKQVDAQVTAILDRRWGRPPAKFTYEGHRYTARSFFAAALPSWSSAGGMELNYEPGKASSVGSTAAYDGVGFKAYQTGNHETLMRVLEETLREGEAPIVQYKVIDEDHTQARGTIGFEVHGLKVPPDFQWNDPDVLDHYVLAIGAQWDSHGRIEKLLVKNTWSTSPSENHGIHWIEADYLFLLESVEVVDRLEAKFKSEGLL